MIVDLCVILCVLGYRKQNGTFPVEIMAAHQFGAET